MLPSLINFNHLLPSLSLYIYTNNTTIIFPLWAGKVQYVGICFSSSTHHELINETFFSLHATWHPRHGTLSHQKIVAGDRGAHKS